MKRVLVSLVATGALLGQLGAVEIYKDGDKSFGVFGVANAVVGYGWNFSSYSIKNGNARAYTRDEQNDIIFGIQGNSRIGINFTIGKVFGAALIGAGESTFRNGSGTAGFRQLYAGYDFGDAGKLLAGKNELVTSMGGFSSSIFDTESGLNGFGGASTSTRRFQITYSIAGVTASISENDVIASGYSAPLKNYRKTIPRISVGYEYKNESIRAKVAASYAYAKATSTFPAAKHIVLITAGVRPVFGDAYLSALLTYGLNAHLAGETKVALATMARGYGNLGVSSNLSLINSNADANTYAAMLEFGYNLTSDLTFKAGVGYQYSSAYTGGNAALGIGSTPLYVAYEKYAKLHSYSAFVQLPYKVGGGFSIIPQLGYLGTTYKGNIPSKFYRNTGNVLAEVMFKIAF